MILLINTYLTNSNIFNYNRGILPSHSKSDVFKYMLASLESIQFTACYIYFNADNTSLIPELNNYIFETLNSNNIFVSNEPNTYQSDWQNTFNKITTDFPEEELFYFFCNHDHINLIYDTTILSEIENLLLNDSEQYVSCYLSHWPELITQSILRDGTISGRYIYTHFSNADSVQLINKNLFRSWFFDHDYGRTLLRRTDFGEIPGGGTVNSPIIKIFTPRFEFFRHFDGYNTPNKCPALTIPTGFFEKNIDMNSFRINPLSNDYKDTSDDGVDFKITPKQIPIFLRNRIRSFTFNTPTTEEIKAANIAQLTIASCKPSRNVHYSQLQHIISPALLS